MRKVVSSAGRFLGANTVCGEDGTPYLTRIWLWRLRLHIFHRGDTDQDAHDHPWDFWTFPLTPYVEEVVTTTLEQTWVPDRPIPAGYDADGEPEYLEYNTVMGGHYENKVHHITNRHVVSAFRPHFRPAEHTHRVIGRYSEWCGNGAVHPTNKKIVTLVWFSKPRRDWGFLKNRDGQWCWVPWKEYVFGGGKDGPCQ